MRRTIILLVVFLVCSTAVCVFFDVDLHMASLFYLPGEGFPIGKKQPWNALYRFGEYPAYIMGTVCLLLGIASFFRPNLYSIRLKVLYVAIVLIIGPGILVNTVFKGYWGRPRPVHVKTFGGKFSFHQPWQPGPASKNASFPAGHPSAAFYMSTPYFTLRENKQRRKALLWLWGGIFFGVTMGIARIVQGGHFVTDVIWSAGFVYLTCIVLASTMLKTSESVTKESECPELIQ